MDTAFTSSLQVQKDGSVILKIPPHVLLQIPDGMTEKVSGQTFWIRMGKRRSNKQNKFLSALVRARLLHNSTVCNDDTIAEEKRNLCNQFGVFEDGERLPTSQYSVEEMSELIQRIVVDCGDNRISIEKELTMYDG